jgi:hypothetical protein
MNIEGVFGEKRAKIVYCSYDNKSPSSYIAQSASSKKDTVEISDEAYAAQRDNNITATSGKDILGASKGDKENTFIVHFADSAMVNRAVSRGYITVNGIDIELSDDIKKKLMETDKKAEADRMSAFNNYIMQHELAVAQQQSEAWKKVTKDATDAFEIAAKISSGRPITTAEAQKLMKYDPQLYAMAMSALAMKKNHQKQEFIKDNHNEQTSDRNVEGVDWSQFEWKTYDSRITVSLGGDINIEDVSEGEIVLNEPRNI